MLQTIAWLILAAIHALPALAFLRPQQLQALYRVGPDNPLFLLLHHRAALFVAVFAACIIAALHPPSRSLAAVITAISMLAFLLLYYRAGAPAALQKIARVDLIGLPVLAFVAYSAVRQALA